jgi:hypothetical protein
MLFPFQHDKPVDKAAFRLPVSQKFFIEGIKIFLPDHTRILTDHATDLGLALKKRNITSWIIGPDPPLITRLHTVKISLKVIIVKCVKIEAPDTEPVSKREIDTGENPQNQIQTVQEPTDNGDSTTPVKKSDIEQPQINPDNKLSNSYRDMMSRMDNLYNDEDEENL